jgi:hypothetical protein
MGIPTRKARISPGSGKEIRTLRDEGRPGEVRQLFGRVLRPGLCGLRGAACFSMPAE